MNPDITIEMLRRSRCDEPLGPEEWRRAKARFAWVKATVAAWAEAQRNMDRRCTETVGRVSEEEFNRIFDEEQAKVDAIRAPLDLAAEKDVWPRELYWSL